MRHLAPLVGSLLLLPAATHAETFREVDGVVSMEAEHFTRNDGYTVRSDNGTNKVAAGWSGDGWVYTDSERKPRQRMDYQIAFTRTGTYYVLLRALAGYNADWSTNYDGDDNGFHAEFDGTPVTKIPGDGIFVLKKHKWVWYGAHQHSSPPKAVSFTVDTPGVHTFSILRREALGRLDKILLRKDISGISGKGKDARSDVTGPGPAETVDNGSMPDAGSAAIDASVPDAGSSAVDASVGSDAGSDARRRIEAEDMALQAYRLESGVGYASNNQMITLRDGAAGETGTASYSFAGDPGLYDVVLAYFDENDGTASLRLHIDGVLLADLDLDEDLGGASSSSQTLVRRTVASAHALKRGSSIRITGVEDPNEPARVDYIELVPVSAASNAGVNDAAQASDSATDDDLAVVVPADAGVVHDTHGAPLGDEGTATGGCATTPHGGQPAALLLGAIVCLAWLRRRLPRP